MPIERPDAGGEIALGDDDLARLGLAVVYESSAKAIAASALRALCSLSKDEWVKLEREKFGELLKRIFRRVEELDDPELASRFGDLEHSVKQAHEVRHIVVHVLWGFGGDGFLGYDYSRGREVTPEDIEKAMLGCAEIRRAALWFAMRVANLERFPFILVRNRRN